MACVGGGSNAIGIFRAFLEADDGVALYGVEAAGEGLESGRHAATLTRGRPGVLHGARSYLLCDDGGQVLEAHSISAGLDYPGVGPEHSALRDAGRAVYLSASDAEALAAVEMLARSEGIIPALETAHALARGPRGGAARVAATRAPGDGAGLPVRARRQGPGHAAGAARRGGPAVSTAPPIGDVASSGDTETRLARVFASARARGRKVLVAYLCVGDPSLEESAALCLAAAGAGADVLELGVPFSDDGDVRHIARAANAPCAPARPSTRVAVAAAVRARARCRWCSSVTTTRSWSPERKTAVERAAAAGIDALLVVDLAPDEGPGDAAAAARAGMPVVPLLARPATTRGWSRARRRARRLVYYVSVTVSPAASGGPRGLAAGRGVAAPREIARAAGFRWWWASGSTGRRRPRGRRCAGSVPTAWSSAPRW